jgi:hypothetical protein
MQETYLRTDEGDVTSFQSDAGVHRFDSSRDAYDACQCCEGVNDGDVLIIASEGVIGIADTWPFAMTQAHGSLHQVQPGTSDADLASGAACYADDPTAKAATFLAGMARAREFAQQLGLTLRD